MAKKNNMFGQIERKLPLTLEIICQTGQKRRRWWGMQEWKGTRPDSYHTVIGIPSWLVSDISNVRWQLSHKFSSLNEVFRPWEEE